MSVSDLKKIPRAREIEYNYPCGTTAPSWDGVKYLIHKQYMAEGPNSSASISIIVKDFLSGLDNSVHNECLNFLLPRKLSELSLRDSVGVSFIKSQSNQGLERQIFLDTACIDKSFDPPEPNIDGRDGQKRAKARLAEPQHIADAELPEIYSERHARRLITPIFEEVKRLIEATISDDRRCPENKNLLASMLIKGLEKDLGWLRTRSRTRR
jgi:hypothetical protein